MNINKNKTKVGSMPRNQSNKLSAAGKYGQKGRVFRCTKKCFENTFYQIERRLNVLAVIRKQEFSTLKDLIECLYEPLNLAIMKLMIGNDIIFARA